MILVNKNCNMPVSFSVLWRAFSLKISALGKMKTPISYSLSLNLTPANVQFVVLKIILLIERSNLYGLASCE